MKKASPELADVVRRFQDPYRARFGPTLLPSHEKTLRDIARCATPAMGGERYRCDDCDREFWIYHGCRNRSCPKCYARRTRKWLELREAELLPCGYFHVIVTVPEELRHAFLSHQKTLYGMLMKISADVLRELASNPRHLGATPGILSVLHTWTAQMLYHPHVHMLVTGGGITADGKNWREPRGKFLVPVRALSKVLRARFRDTLRQKMPEVFDSVDSGAWTRDWCTYCKPYGSGKDAVLAYLARYVHRIALCNSRILAVDETHVTFRYKDRDADAWRTMRLEGVEFLRRFLMHVLPRGFHKVRYYGLWHPACRAQAARAWLLLLLQTPVDRDGPLKLAELTAALRQLAADSVLPNEPEHDPSAPECPRCGSRRTRFLFRAHPPPVPP